MCLVSFVVINVKHNDGGANNRVQAWLRRHFSSQHRRSGFYSLPDEDTSDTDEQTEQPPPYLDQRRSPSIAAPPSDGGNRRAIVRIQR